MGRFAVTIGVGHPYRGVLAEVEAVVDTGATHSMIPASLLEALGVQAYTDRMVGFANGTVETRPLGVARIAYGGEEWPCPVFFGPEDQYLLGATALEALGLVVDPTGERLVPVIYVARPF